MAYRDVHSSNVTPPPSTRYGSISSSFLGRPYAAAENEKGLPSSKLDKPSLQDGRDIFMRRALVATSIILMLGLSVLATLLRPVTDTSEGERNVRDFQDEPEPDLEARSIGVLTLETTNEYGPSDKHALAMYGYEMVIEPFRDTVIHVTHSTAPARAQHASQYHWLMLPLDDDGIHRESTGPVLNSRGGSHVNVNLEDPGRTYHLAVKQYGIDGQEVVAEGWATVSCKYVRRELRTLTEADRIAFFEAMRVFYTITTEEAYRLYGSDFSNSIRMATVHNSQTYCYHGGMHFPLAHAAFNLVVERSLQRVNPRVSLPSWDFMIESGTLGAEWPTSVVFSHWWFGSAFGNPENDYQIKDGYFANISSVFDPYDNLVDPRISPIHNPYGYLGGSYDYTDLGGVVRTHTFCGMRGEVVFPQCAVVVDCFESSESLYEWTYCMESQVHATMHGLIGGGYNCNTDMEEFLQMHPKYSRGLLTFVLEYLLGSTWPSNHLMSDYNTCDTSCAHGQKTPCGCTCNTDPFEWSDAEVRAFMTSSLTTLSANAGADLWIDDTGDELGFKQNGKRLSEDETLFLLRTMMVIGCEPGGIGAMSSGASPTDPIFWVLHPMFEKALHIVNLSPKYAGSYTFDWVASTCYGSDFTDELPFTEQALGLGNGTDFLTNEDLGLVVYSLRRRKWFGEKHTHGAMDVLHTVPDS